MKKLCLGFLLFCIPVGLRAQTPATDRPQSDGATSCATNTLSLDLLADEFIKGKFSGEFIIIISRLAKKEATFGSLHFRRLFTVVHYLNKRTNNKMKIVSAKGETSGDKFGRVEVYTKGRLSFALVLSPCEDIPILICDDRDAAPEYYLDRSFHRKCN